MSRDDRGRFWLSGRGAHTHLHSTLCHACPHHVAGCCSHPPPYDWADVARVLVLGGRGHLEASLAGGQLTFTPTGLRFATPKRKDSPSAPRTARCVFLGAGGCTLDAREKPAVCNYYVCDDAMGGAAEAHRATDGPDAVTPFLAYGALRELWTRWTAEVSRVVAEAYPAGPASLDDGLVALLVATYERLEAAAGLRDARPPPLPERPRPP